jgi:excisionase family DNA binding protein
VSEWEAGPDWDSSEGLATPEEVAKEFGVSIDTVGRWARTRKIPAIRPGGEWRLSRAWINKHRGSFGG